MALFKKLIVIRYFPYIWTMKCLAIDFVVECFVFHRPLFELSGEWSKAASPVAKNIHYSMFFVWLAGLFIILWFQVLSVKKK